MLHIGLVNPSLYAHKIVRWSTSPKNICYLKTFLKHIWVLFYIKVPLSILECIFCLNKYLSAVSKLFKTKVWMYLILSLHCTYSLEISLIAIKKQIYVAERRVLTFEMQVMHVCVCFYASILFVSPACIIDLKPPLAIYMTRSWT